MPSKPRRISQKLVEQEGRLQLAISAIEKNEISSIRPVADIFDVPLSTLCSRLDGRQYQIGTYAGLNKVHQNTKNQVRHEEVLDKELFAGLSVPIPAVDDLKALSVTRRVSRKMDAISSHLVMVVESLQLDQWRALQEETGNAG
ncbi:hypothetical protein KXV43_003946 [Aspergillus fumigatus]|nr:hypothetical protein KXV43_003946 [Aspergillus fumigatus]